MSSCSLVLSPRKRTKHLDSTKKKSTSNTYDPSQHLLIPADESFKMQDTPYQPSRIWNLESRVLNFEFHVPALLLISHEKSSFGDFRTWHKSPPRPLFPYLSLLQMQMHTHNAQRTTHPRTADLPTCLQ